MRLSASTLQWQGGAEKTSLNRRRLCFEFSKVSIKILCFFFFFFFNLLCSNTKSITSTSNLEQTEETRIRHSNAPKRHSHSRGKWCRVRSDTTVAFVETALSPSLLASQYCTSSNNNQGISAASCLCEQSSSESLAPPFCFSSTCQKFRFRNQRHSETVR